MRADDKWTTMALWLNEHMPATGQREWLQWVLDSVPEDKRLLTALALSVAHWHREAVSRGGREDACALCAYHLNIYKIWYCKKCPADKVCRDVYHGWYHAQDSYKDETADAVYEDLKQLYDVEWRRANEK